MAAKTAAKNAITEGVIWKQVLIFFFPLLLGAFFQQMYNTADTIIVGRFLGKEALSAVGGSSGRLIDMLIYVMIGLSSGASVIIAQLYGSKNYTQTHRAVHTAMAFALIIGLTASIIGFIVTPNVLKAIATPPDVLPFSIVYMRIYFIGLVPNMFYNMGASILRAVGDSKRPFIFLIITCFVNIALDLLFIVVFKMGVEGVAIPSLVSRFIAAIIMLVLIRNKKNVVYVDHQNFKPEFGMIRRILYIAIPSGMENGIFQFGRIIVVSIISTFGTVQIAANAVANSIDGMGTLCGQAISLAMITVVGQCVGAGDLKQVRLYTKKLLKIAYILTICVNSTILLTLPWILKIFSLSDETRSLAFILICIHNGCAILLWPLSFVLPNALRACNDVKYTMVVSIFSMCMFRIVFSYIIGQYFGMGAIGVWIAMIIDWIFRVIFFVYRFVSGKWEKLTYANR